MKLVVMAAVVVMFGAVASSGEPVSVGFFAWWIVVAFGLGMWVSNSRHKNMAIAVASAHAQAKARSQAAAVAQSSQHVVVNVSDYLGGGAHRRLDASEYVEALESADHLEFMEDGEDFESVAGAALGGSAPDAVSVEAADPVQAEALGDFDWIMSKIRSRASSRNDVDQRVVQPVGAWARGPQQLDPGGASAASAVERSKLGRGEPAQPTVWPLDAATTERDSTNAVNQRSRHKRID